METKAKGQPEKKPTGKGIRYGGKQKAIESPEELWRLFELYVTWAKNNPLTKMDFKGKDADEVTYKIERPLTKRSFDAFLFKRGVISMLRPYRENRDERYSDYVPVIQGIDEIIDAYQVEGAMAGLLKENLVSRLQGIKDKIDTGGEVTIKHTKIGFE